MLGNLFCDSDVRIWFNCGLFEDDSRKETFLVFKAISEQENLFAKISVMSRNDFEQTNVIMYLLKMFL